MSIEWISNKNTKKENRSVVFDYLKNKKKDNQNYKILDVGGASNPWADGYVDTYLDIQEMDGKDVIVGDILKPDVWKIVKERQFDFIICSHTLEDISNPEYVINKILECCSSGYISMPNKHVEMSHVESLRYLGYMHHQYIFTFQNDTLVALRKSVALCYFINIYLRIFGFDIFSKIRRVVFGKSLLLHPYSSNVKWLNKCINTHEHELAFVWEDKFDFKYLNNNFIPSLKDYLKFVTDDIVDGY